MKQDPHLHDWDKQFYNSESDKDHSNYLDPPDLNPWPAIVLFSACLLLILAIYWLWPS